MRWKIYFVDGDTFSSEDGSPNEAPLKGVAVITVEDGRCGRRVLKYCDWYRYDHDYDRWFDCTEFDVLLHLTRHGSVVARRGQYMADDAFEKILIAAHDDPFIKAFSPDEPPHPAWRA